MVVVVLLLAAGFMTVGAWAVAWGAPIIQIERGWATVIAGSVALSAGAVLLGLFAVLRALRRLAPMPGPPPARPAAARPERVPDLRVAREIPVAAGPEPDDAAAPGDPSSPVLDPPLAEAPHVVGTYEADGSAYVMYSDGSIVARTASGTSRFRSIEDLKASVPARPGPRR